MPDNNHDIYISVDIETAGPNPSQYSILSIGACTISEPRYTFYIEVKPVNGNFNPDAQAIHGLTFDALTKTGVPATDAMQRFGEWLQQVTPSGHKPIFVAFNAPFDWMFINDYFHRFLGYNPFGHSAIDMKAYYMGLTGCRWSQTTMNKVSNRFLKKGPLSHHALEDALLQADLFVQMVAEANKETL